MLLFPLFCLKFALEHCFYVRARHCFFPQLLRVAIRIENLQSTTQLKKQHTHQSLTKRVSPLTTTLTFDTKRLPILLRGKSNDLNNLPPTILESPATTLELLLLHRQNDDNPGKTQKSNHCGRKHCTFLLFCLKQVDEIKRTRFDSRENSHPFVQFFLSLVSVYNYHYSIF